MRPMAGVVTEISRRAGERAGEDRGADGPIHAFASRESATRKQLVGAPVRWPRPSRLQMPLPGASGKLASGLESLGLRTVGDLLEHLPRDTREARTISALQPGEQA